MVVFLYPKLGKTVGKSLCTNSFITIQSKRLTFVSISIE